jgi:hypothetical protein
VKTTPAFKETIKSYLEKRGSKDPLFARIIMKPGKNMDDCITYILNTVKSSGCNGFTDDEVYNMAIHYFDEDNIIIGSKMDMQVVINHKVELTELEIAEARKTAIQQLIDETKAAQKKKVDKKIADIKKEDDSKPDAKIKTLF